jgi:SAM-dependent methyltransferase
VDCGLAYIQNVDDALLSRFYSDECSYFEKPHFDVAAPANSRKYAAYREFIVAHGLANVSIVDIGCGRGGFLSWLKLGGWDRDCYGVDIDSKSLLLVDANVTFKIGQALALPFENNSQSLLTYFHVAEHIRDIDKMLEEAFRTIKVGGHVLIEVPDAENYARRSVGSAFWISIREHVYHFSARSLGKALNRHGFFVVEVKRQVLPTPEFEYPSLMVLAQKRGGDYADNCAPAGDIAAFVLESQRALMCQVERVNALIEEHRNVTFWGCSSELLSLLPRLKVDELTICDASKEKQRLTYMHWPILDPANVKPGGILVIAPYLHGDAIERDALALGWKPHAIVRLT